MPIDRRDFVTACRMTLELARSSEVAEAWDRESSCSGMSVGGLTHHVLSQARHVQLILSAPPGTQEPIPLLDHYARAAWVEASPDDEANVSIRDEGDRAAAAGPAAVLAESAAVVDLLPELLAEPRVPDVAHIPWQGWSLTTDDFLVTRAMELVVHSDDLADSVGLPSPELPDSVVSHVVGLLGGVALRRHGQTAVVRALSRPQRAPGSISAF